MQHSSFLPLAAGAVAMLTLAGCETTGDPTQGGLFGWSEGKAKARQSALREALYVEEDRTASARSQTSGLEASRSRNAAAIRSQRARLSRMESQLDEIDRAGGRAQTAELRSRINSTSGSDNLDDASMRQQVNDLDREVGSLRREYGLLQKRR
jgi:predicted  nucleic acid-binding Zn-ribbon protein